MVGVDSHVHKSLPIPLPAPSGQRAARRLRRRVLKVTHSALPAKPRLSGFMFVLKEPSSQKRQRTSLESTTDDQSPAAKRQKSSPEKKARSGYRPPSFWDTLSKIRLSRGALREFDRRNNQTKCSPSLLPEPTTISLPGQDLHKIKRFARHGGPNLAHFRGVCSSCIRGVSTCG